MRRGQEKLQRHLLLQKNQIWKSLYICTQMTFFARDYAKTIDCYEMFLITNRSNISACKCYEKAGGINDADDEVVYVYDFREEN